MRIYRNNGIYFEMYLQNSRKDANQMEMNYVRIRKLSINMIQYVISRKQDYTDKKTVVSCHHFLCLRKQKFGLFDYRLTKNEPLAY